MPYVKLGTEVAKLHEFRINAKPLAEKQQKVKLRPNVLFKQSKKRCFWLLPPWIQKNSAPRHSRNINKEKNNAPTYSIGSLLDE